MRLFSSDTQATTLPILLVCLGQALAQSDQRLAELESQLALQNSLPCGPAAAQMAPKCPGLNGVSEAGGVCICTDANKKARVVFPLSSAISCEWFASNSKLVAQGGNHWNCDTCPGSRTLLKNELDTAFYCTAPMVP